MFKQVTYDYILNFSIVHTLSMFLAHDECNPKHKIVFAKTHKTGGSTFQNILFRHCLRNNLSIAFPTAKTWMFGFKQPFNASQVKGYHETENHEEPEHRQVPKSFDVFLFHSVWNYKEVRKVVSNGPSVTLIREPADMFESGYVYFGNKPKV